MTVILRYSNVKRGAVYITGNTLGLAGNSSFQPSGPGNVQAFITTDTTVATASGWSGIANLSNDENVTNQWSLNSAMAHLNIPQNSNVLYAELVWPSSVAYSSTVLPIADQNIAVKLTAPDNTVNHILPDTITMQSVILSPPDSQFNVRSADVTSLIQSKGSGQYTVGGVPCYLNYPGNVAIGWALIVIYENSLEPWRSLSLNISNQLVNPSTTVDIPVSGFIAPEVGSVNGRVAMVAIEGDNWNGDSVRFGPTISSLTTLSGPNNPVTNFFSSQINNNTGNLDTTGTFGTRNFYPPGATTPIGSRQGFDLTNVSISGILPNNQRNGVFRFQTSSDGYVVNALAVQVDVNAANLTPILKIPDKNYAELGDTISYTVVLNNSGSTTAFNITFIDTVPSETIFIQNSVTINGISYPSYNPNPPGFSLNNMGVGSKTTVTFKVVTNTILSSSVISNISSATYSFKIADTIPDVLDASYSNLATTTISYSTVQAEKIVDKYFANIGEQVTYSVVIKNYGNATVSNILFIDTIPNNASIVLNSFKQDTTTIVQTSNFINVTLPNDIAGGNISTVTFKINIESLPLNNPMTNSATIKNRFIVDPLSGILSKVELSTITNITTTSILKANLSDIVKYSDKKYATVGETITYTIVVPNTGNVEAYNCNFVDTIPNGTIFINNTLKVNNDIIIGVNPGIGFNLGTIMAGEVKTITFKVKVE